MLKITAVFSLMLIATWSQADTKRQKKDLAGSGTYDSGSTMLAESLSCDSCGSECESACGTRHFRSCCFNYLRKKRGPDTLKFLTRTHQFKTPTDLHIASDKNRLQVVENLPEWWSPEAILLPGRTNEYRPSEDVDPRLFEV